MPISFKDKNGKKHVFKDHAEAVTWMKKNRPDIKDPDAFVATLERNQNKGKSSKFALHNHGEIFVSSLITGKLTFDKDDNVKVKNVEIFLEGISDVIVEIEVVEEDFGASFTYIIDARARAGTYKVVWNVIVDGEEFKVFNSFIINADNMDRTLPMELQHLR